MGDSSGGPGRGPRCIALVGPYLSGKTTLLEAILARTGVVSRQGKVTEKNTVGDASPEARGHGMSVEVNAATTDFLGDRYTFIDCPGSIEFLGESTAVLPGVDAAVVVCEPDEKKIPALQLILKQLEDMGIPRFLFLNKIDKAEARVRDVLSILQPASATPLVLRQVPIWENDIVTGFIDLALDRAYVYREHAPSEVVGVPDELNGRRDEARYSMLERLADYDDELMEQLLEDIEPPRDKIFEDLGKELADGVIVPVLIGSAENGNGILRLLKALRHEAPGVAATVERLGAVEGAGASAQVLKTFHTAHGGKLSLVRVLSGKIADGAVLYGAKGDDERVAGVFTLMGQEPKKQNDAAAGDTVALGRLESIATGETLSSEKGTPKQLVALELPEPVYGMALAARERKDEVKLTGALAKIMEEDPSIALEHNQTSHEMVVWGQGEMHLRVALERLTGKYGIAVDSRRPKVGYLETIRKPITQRGRHKKQSGGHGQFGDVVIEIKPLPRGGGFVFSDKITGGVVPKQYISSVEAGVRDYLDRGPLGFPVVDVAVTLIDGSYHSVDSSDMAFRTAGRIGMSEGMPQCAPVLLEPILAVEINVPSEATAKINGIISQRRGQILGFDARPGWNGWDSVQAHMPAAEMHDLIVELRSATAGVGTYTFKFDHLSELTGKLAEQVLAESKAEAA
ncbi:MAG: elongation factor G [Hyphomicrobiales bacterium]|nr:elongation factor G [Hyphomicrobiales bacterium]